MWVNKNFMAVFISFGWISRSRMAGSYCRYILRSVGNLCAVFHNCTSLYPCQHCIRVPSLIVISSATSVTFFDFWMIGVLTSLRWNLIMIFSYIFLMATGSCVCWLFEFHLWEMPVPFVSPPPNWIACFIAEFLVLLTYSGY